MEGFGAVNDFQEAVEEINLLINYAKRNTKDIKRYATFNKTAIILLCTKFETFLENFLEEYCFVHLKNSTNRNLNQHIYNHLVEGLIDDLTTNKTRPEKRDEILGRMINLCGTPEYSEVEVFSTKPKFSYGKHGQNEIQRLLKQFGFQEFLEKDSTTDFFGRFNSLNFVRNNIIHEDATPSLTHQDVEKYLHEIKEFVGILSEDARLEVEKI